MAGRILVLTFAAVFVAFGCDVIKPSATKDTSAGKPNAPPVPSTKPESPPFDLKEPAAERKQYMGEDLSTLSFRELDGWALEKSEAGDGRAAVQMQYWALKNGPGNDGQYNMACFYSRVNRVDEAIYWLQISAEKQGVDSEWASEDADLANVRRDKRWPKLLRFLKQYEAYWATSDLLETSLIVPKGYDGKTPLRLVIALHGMGSSPTNYVDDDYQEWADTHRTAFLAVSGTQPRGPTSFVWSENAAKDYARLKRGLKSVSNRLVVKPGEIVLTGFSQGGMMAAEIAARHPDEFAGAIILSPGGNALPRVRTISANNSHRKQGYMVFVGGGELPGNVMMAKIYDTQLRKLTPRVKLLIDPKQRTHSFPREYFEKLPQWVEYVLNR